jgi:hypothetical protein
MLFVEAATFESETLGMPLASISFPNGLGAFVLRNNGKYDLTLTEDGIRTFEMYLGTRNIIGLTGEAVEEALAELAGLA